MLLYILEGCHASGKTTIIEKIKENNKDIVVINEDYYTIENFELGTPMHQYQWLMNWVNKVSELKKKNTKVVVSDRGPLSSIIYNGEKYDTLIKDIMEYLKNENIRFYNLYLQSPDKNEHIERIKKRSGKLVEKELKFLEETLRSYEFYAKDYTVIYSYETLINFIKNTVTL